MTQVPSHQRVCQTQGFEVQQRLDWTFQRLAARFEGGSGSYSFPTLWHGEAPVAPTERRPSLSFTPPALLLLLETLNSLFVHHTCRTDLQVPRNTEGRETGQLSLMNHGAHLAKSCF